ncbi:3-deoxy-manno-octulosonate cytidylyltransferase (CMP-KDO synthetase) [Advenella incenata]|uniref:3-deoxy-manno-octulosonate cytidylyltransferase n=1 Tax=Advenella incenata TaxID=267800 RepID=A0A4Q7V634_9BURK|nr:3-deoxy-manno-octulosonate cytidylyltransferase [Advenella incenata]RZT92026.1 3-deoxy-manno-octulosonate cytidylyltransferase (CMP-KDO synthetase) [Advenella incenata]
MTGFIVIVPARAASTRLPGKMLADIGGLPMVVRTAQQAARSAASQVYIATDDQHIADVVRHHGYTPLLTRADHPSGTDRLAEVVAQLALPDDQVIVNVQGDEPMIEPDIINLTAADLLAHSAAAISTCAYPLADRQDFFNPNIVKVVCSSDQYALYFSRAPIPWARNHFAADNTDSGTEPSALPTGFPALHHIGLYAYRSGFLKIFPSLTQGALETFESLEQLRALEHGFRIHVLVTANAPMPGIDTQEDLERVRGFYRNSV